MAWRRRLLVVALVAGACAVASRFGGDEAPRPVGQAGEAPATGTRELGGMGLPATEATSREVPGVPRREAPDVGPAARESTPAFVEAGDLETLPPPPPVAGIPAAPAEGTPPPSSAGFAEVDRLVAGAVRLEEQQRIAEAVAAFRRVLHLEPGNPEALSGLQRIQQRLLSEGWSRVAARDFDGARRLFLRARSVLDDPAALEALAALDVREPDRPPPLRQRPELRLLGRNAQGRELFERQRDGGRVVGIPGGAFVMGSNREAPDEAPEHVVVLSPYLMDEREVTRQQFARYLEKTGAPEPIGWRLSHEADPMALVRWDEADAFCRWVGGRLPSEAEWEYAARGTDGRQYPWGETWEPQRANAEGALDGFEFLAPVGTYPQGASPFGLLDMAGNLSEWMADWYGPYAGLAQWDPRGPAAGDARVLRGGSFWDDRQSLRTTSRVRGQAYHRAAHNWVGFRCAHDEP